MFVTQAWGFALDSPEHICFSENAALLCSSGSVHRLCPLMELPASSWSVRWTYNLSSQIELRCISPRRRLPGPRLLMTRAGEDGGGASVP